VSATDWIAAAGGLLLVAAALRDVFHTLLHPSGVGQLTPAVFRGAWRLAQRLGGRAMDLAGPLALVSSIALWTLMLVIGWALVHWPHMPQAFQLAEGVPSSTQGDFLESLYLSAVALSTLGFGDIVAEAPGLRLALVLEAIIGFALLTASISWVLSIYPTLMRRRTLAAQIGTLLEGEREDVRLVCGPPSALALVLHRLSEQLGTTRIDLIQYPASYFFHDPAATLSLPAALCRLQRALTRDDMPETLRPAAKAVRTSIDELTQTLREAPFRLAGDDSQAVLHAYAAHHNRG